MVERYIDNTKQNTIFIMGNFVIFATFCRYTDCDLEIFSL